MLLAGRNITVPPWQSNLLLLVLSIGAYLLLKKGNTERCLSITVGEQAALILCFIHKPKLVGEEGL